MAFCGKCGNQINDEVKFCPICGTPIGNGTQEGAAQSAQPAQSAPQAGGQSSFGAKLATLNNTTDNTADFDKADVETNKAMGILSYFGPLVLIPIFAAPKSKYARYHANQGLILLLAEIAYGIIYSILSAILIAISWRLYFIVSIIGIISIIFVVLAVIGIINAVNGRAKELPIIGKFRILK